MKSTRSILLVLAAVLVAVLVWTWPDSRTKAAELRAPMRKESEPKSSQRLSPAPDGGTRAVAPERESATPASHGQEALVVAAPARSDTASAVQGKVVDLDGAGIGSLQVVFVPTNTASRAASELAAISATDGRFELGISEQGRVVVRSDNYVTVAEARVRPGDRDVHVVVAWRSELDGRVIDRATGAGLEGARLRIVNGEEALNRLGLKHEHSAFAVLATTTEADGRFAFHDAAEIPRAFLTATKTGYRPQFTEIATFGGQPCLIQLEKLVRARGALAGQVLTEDGSPVEGAYVAVGALAASTDAAGTFVLDTAAPSFQSVDADAPVVVRAVKRGVGSTEQELVSRSRAAIEGWPEWIVLELRSSRRVLGGRVTSTTGEPLTAVRVRLMDPTPFGFVNEESTSHFMQGGYVSRSVEELSCLESLQVETDSNGRFAFDCLQDRSYTLFVVDPQTVCAMTTPPIRSGREDVHLSLDVSRVGRLAGRVVDLAGAPVAKVTVAVSCSDRAGWTERGPSVETDADGRFVIEGTATEDVALQLFADSLVPEPDHPISPAADKEHLLLRVARRCHVQFDWRPWESEGVDLAILDEQGAPIPIQVIVGDSWRSVLSLPVAGEQSEVVVLRENAAHATLSRDAQEVRRFPLALTPGEVTRVRLVK